MILRSVHTQPWWFSRWWLLLKNSIHSSASRRQRDITLWPQEGHFNKGAWEEATKHWDDRMGFGISGLNRGAISSLWTLWTLIRPQPANILTVFHHLMQHLRGAAASALNLVTQVTEFAFSRCRRDKPASGSVPSPFAFSKWESRLPSLRCSRPAARPRGWNQSPDMRACLPASLLPGWKNGTFPAPLFSALCARWHSG